MNYGTGFGFAPVRLQKFGAPLLKRHKFATNRVVGNFWGLERSPPQGRAVRMGFSAGRAHASMAKERQGAINGGLHLYLQDHHRAFAQKGGVDTRTV